MSSQRPNLFRAWWPAGVWVGLIGIESTSYLSSENTGRALYSFLTRIFGQIDFYSFLFWHHFLRKSGHFMGYGMLSLLLLRGFHATFRENQAFDFRVATLALLGTVLVATLDEWHQSFIPSRTGTPRDVLLDSAAGLIFLIVAYLWLRRSTPARRAA